MLRILARQTILSSSIFRCGLVHPSRSFACSSLRFQLTRELLAHRFARYSSAPQRLTPLSKQLEGTVHQSFAETVGKPGVRRQMLFVAIGSLLAFTYAANRTNFETDIWVKRLLNASHIWSIKEISSVDLKRAQHAELIKDLREWYAIIHGKVQEAPGIIRPWLSLAYVSIMQPYADATEGKRLTWKICLLNVGVYIAWKIRKFQGPMLIRFMHHPLSGLSYTLLTSMFSHRSFFHLLLNCLALESFGSAAYYYFVKEQARSEPPLLESTANWHFLAFFVSAGLFSGLVSHLVSVRFHYPRLVAELSRARHATKRTDTWAAAVSAASQTAKEATTKPVTTILPSLGASGAVYAAVTLTALAFPESQVALFIPPSYPIPIQWGVGGLVAFDLLGIIRGWKMLDHWAHLGGAAFGALYYLYGPQFWNFMRRGIIFEERPSSSALS